MAAVHEMAGALGVVLHAFLTIGCKSYWKLLHLTHDLAVINTREVSQKIYKHFNNKKHKHNLLYLIPNTHKIILKITAVFNCD